MSTFSIFQSISRCGSEFVQPGAAGYIADSRHDPPFALFPPEPSSTVTLHHCGRSGEQAVKWLASIIKISGGALTRFF
jgi:hypothetical protein